MSLSNYTTLVSQGNSPFIAIPVFPSCVFRHGYFFINTDKGIEHPRRSRRKAWRSSRIFPMTAGVYMRGLLQHEYRRDAQSDLDWVQGRTDRLGRKLPLGYPPASREIRKRGTRRPAGTRRDRLHDDGQQSDLVSQRLAQGARGCFPTMPRLRRTITGAPKSIRSCTPWSSSAKSATAIHGWRYSASTRLSARQRSARTACWMETGSPKASFAWLQPMIEEEQKIIGQDWYPYGLEVARPTRSCLARCCNIPTSRG